MIISLAFCGVQFASVKNNFIFLNLIYFKFYNYLIGRNRAYFTNGKKMCNDILLFIFSLLDNLHYTYNSSYSYGR